MGTPWKSWGLEPFGPVPNARHMEWYRRGKTAFLHFTVNTFTDREWGDGTESPEQFAPSALDCRQWARLLRDAGFTAAILTAKHHDGFCLWPSRFTEHSVKNSPGSPDVVRLFTDACREYGLKPGLYLSPWDRNHPQWGTESYNDYYAGQLTELMTEYGEIFECWWDGAGSAEASYDWQRWARIIRRYQPHCVIFGCLGAAEYADVRWVGNESGCAGSACYATIDPASVEAENTAQLNSGKPDGSRFMPAETNLSIRPGWFYHACQDNQVKTPEELVDYWFHSAGRNTAIVLNLPPDRRGRIHEKDAESVLRWRRMLEQIFANNLALGAQVTAAAALHPDCGAENLLCEDEYRIYAAGERTPEICLRFAAPVSFDCFRVDEVIELGHRVRGFALDAWQEGVWRIILTGECIGFCQSRRFDTVTAERVRLRITEAAAFPVLRFFGLYDSGGIGLLKKDEHRTERWGNLQLQRSGEELIVDLGGIYAYNAVAFDTEGVAAFEIHAFRGTRYEKVFAGTGGETIFRFPTVTGSYKLKIVVTDGRMKEDAAPQVYCL